MHTFQASENIIFIHNGDFSGNTIIKDLRNNSMISISTNCIFDFVAEYLRQQRISDLESMSTNELLNG